MSTAVQTRQGILWPAMHQSIKILIFVIAGIYTMHTMHTMHSSTKIHT